MKNEKDKSYYYIKSVKKTIEVLNIFLVENKELTITEISKKLNINKSTVLRILRTLDSEDMLIEDQNTHKYSLGIALYRLGLLVKEKLNLREKALPIMEKLVKKTKESVYLSVIAGRERVAIEKIESSSYIRRVVKLGEALPLYTGGTGKVLLAFLSDAEIEEYISKEKISPFTQRTIINSRMLLKELKEVRKNGYAIAIGERIPDATAIGVPIFDYTGKAIACLTLSGPTERIPSQKLTKFISLLKEASSEISYLLGYYSQRVEQK